MNPMNTLNDLIHNPVLVCTACSWLLAQVLKTFLYTAINRTFNAERLVGTGGMPSSHSATVCGLTTSIFLTCGAESVEFAIAVALSLIVMYDALGIRRQAGKQARIINEMMDTFANMGQQDISGDVRLKELVGHTPLQVACGALLGIIVAVILCSTAYA